MITLLYKLGVLATALIHEVLVILYTKGVVGERVWVTVLITAALSVLGFLGVLYVVDDVANIFPATVGHAVGVPVGIFLSRRLFRGRSDAGVL